MIKIGKKENSIAKEKKEFKREYIFIGIAVLVLVILIALLVRVLFFGKRTDIIVPDAPTYDSLDIGIVDFADESANSLDLNSKKSNSLSVSYNIISDYYTEGILLSNTQVEFLNDEFIITSGPFSSIPFVSSISKDGKLKWLTKINNKDFEECRIYKTIFIGKYYYALAVTKKSDVFSLTAIKLTLDGKVDSIKVIKQDIDEKIKDVIYYNNKIIIVTSGGNDIYVYFTDENLSANEKKIKISEVIDKSDYLNYEGSSVSENSLYLVINNSEQLFKTTINTDEYTASTSIIEGIDLLNTDGTINIGSYLNGFTAYTDKVLYKFDSNFNLINKFDYSTVKLEDDTKYKEKYKDDEFIEVENTVNNIYIENVTKSSNSIIVNATTLFSSIYDIYDADLRVQKRIILDTFKYSYPEGVLLKSFYIDENIYEIYSYGAETPSIMISKIG